MTHNFEEILTPTSANPNETAPESAMPPRAWGTLRRDAVQGLCPPLHPRNYPPMAPDGPYQVWAIGAPQTPPPTPPPGHWEGKGQREGPRQEGTR